jgi:hypothetical protein
MKATAERGLVPTPLPALPLPRFASTKGGTCAFFFAPLLISATAVAPSNSP